MVEYNARLASRVTSAYDSTHETLDQIILSPDQALFFVEYVCRVQGFAPPTVTFDHDALATMAANGWASWGRYFPAERRISLPPRPFLVDVAHEIGHHLMAPFSVHGPDHDAITAECERLAQTWLKIAGPLGQQESSLTEDAD